LLTSTAAWAEEPGTPGEAGEVSGGAPPSAEPPEAEVAEVERGTEAAPAAQERSGPRTANSLQLGVGFRYGINMGEDGDLNPWGTGLGLDVGYTLPNAIHIGGSFEYFFGESADVPGGLRISSNIWQLSAEGGYDVGLGDHFVIRPKVGVGIASAMVKLDNCPTGTTCGDESDTHPLIAPGATIMLFAGGFSLAVDTRYALVLADTTAKALIFSVGVGF
jgi:hypothetical protein